MSSHELHNQKRLHEPNAKLGVDEVCKNLMVTVFLNVKSLIYPAQFNFGKVNTDHLPSQFLPIFYRLVPSSLALDRYERLIPALLPF